MTTSASHSDRRGSLWCIALLACGEREPQGAPQAANGDMYLRAQAGRPTCQHLIFRPLFVAPGVLMRPGDAGIDDQIFVTILVSAPVN
ncbi:hypothetical protein CWO91_29880 [Bradyrhizobium genosp. SA-3]|nr:hypothetical protein CWO91_29880 [Bradyrhizobium genosp. SA-3]